MNFNHVALAVIIAAAVPAAFASDGTTVSAEAAPLTSGTLRVATYNIPFLTTEVERQGTRLQNLRRVVEAIQPDMVALQEVKDRQAAELVFPPDSWHVVIDDESPDEQDLAVAVRKNLTLQNIPADLDADDDHFLFSGAEHEQAFPNRRDALHVVVAVPGTSKTIELVSVHGKSRLGGRDVTDPRREEAARRMAEKLKTFGSRTVIVAGDFNDNPDDRALNILETGDPNTTGGAEEEPGALMTNLLEPLLAQDLVSHGANVLKQTPGGLLDIKVPGSRDRNNRYRGRGVHTGPILFDQILISTHARDAVVSGSVTIFQQPYALEGAGGTRPSDHLPVYADIDISKLP